MRKVTYFMKLRSIPHRKVDKPAKSRKPHYKSRPVQRTGEFLSKREICGSLGISLRTLEGWVKKGIFPAPTGLTKQTLRWPRTALEKFLEDASTRAA
jgi:predicted DNA-binding transcriptional regulator AlpA